MTFDEQYERALSFLPDDTAAAAKGFRLMRRRALRLGDKQAAWLALEGLRNVSRFTGNQRWNLQLCRALVKEQRDAFRLMTLAIIEFETGRLQLAEEHLVEAISLAEVDGKIDMRPWHIMLAKIRLAARPSQ